MMSHNEQKRLVHMVNQIAINNISAGDESAVADVVVGHVKKFWPRRMKQILSDYLKKGGEDLHPAVQLAAERLSDKEAS